MANKQALVYKLVIAVLVIIIIAAAGIFFLPGIFPGDLEKATIKRLDFAETEWIEKIMTENVPLYEKDFLINEAYVYSEAEGKLVLTYATKAEMDDLRAHFKANLTDYKEENTNDQGNLSLSGFADKRKVSVRNYFSEVTNIIEITLVFDGENEQLLRQKVVANFPEEALASAPLLSEFMAGETTSGYVLYDYDEYSDRFYAGSPIFSRSYSSVSTLGDLKKSIDGLAEHYSDPKTAIISDGEALIKADDYLFSVSAIEVKGQAKTVLTVQHKP